MKNGLSRPSIAALAVAGLIIGAAGTAGASTIVARISAQSEPSEDTTGTALDELSEQDDLVLPPLDSAEQLDAAADVEEEQAALFDDDASEDADDDSARADDEMEDELDDDVDLDDGDDDDADDDANELDDDDADEMEDE